MNAPYGKILSPKATPANEPIPGRTDQVKNASGGYVFQVDGWKRLERFLILGSEGGSYYVSERQLTLENAQCVLTCARENYDKCLEVIVDISHSGRAPKNGPAIFALAMLTMTEFSTENRAKALAALPKVCRIGTHLFEFNEHVEHLRGRGRALNTAMLNWYTSRNLLGAVKQVTKYQSRVVVKGSRPWSHFDIFRMLRPKASQLPAGFDGLVSYITKKENWREKLAVNPSALSYLNAVETVKSETAEKAQVIELIMRYELPFEVVNTKWLADPDVYRTFVPHMKADNLIRSLGKMGAIGLLTPMSDTVSTVVSKLSDGAWLREQRLHPFKVLQALCIYRQGRGEKGKLTWNVDSNVAAALDNAFYTCFQNVEPAGKRFLLGIDVSSSMGWPENCVNGLSAMDAAGAMAMTAVRSEPLTYACAFASGHTIKDVNLAKTDSLPEVIRKLRSVGMGATDCSLPMRHALAAKIPVDVFVVYTDNETNSGTQQPIQALRAYREKMGINAKLVVVAFTANGFTIADPNDSGMLDICGMDASVPAVLSDFAKH